MTPKLARLLESEVATPCVALDLDVVEDKVAEFRAAMPGVQVYYAVKANPAPRILQRLVGLGACFDAASLEEIEACLKAGAAAASISFGNTVKKAGAIRAAFRLGVGLYAFDSEAELEKLAVEAPGAAVYCRIAVGNTGAEWPLSRKFGCSTTLAGSLMRRAAELGLRPVGISFHVGSQQTLVHAWDAAIAAAAGLIRELREAGLPVDLLNIGGGFPARYRTDVPALGAIGAAIMAALARNLPGQPITLMAEPGRGLVAEAGVLVSEVVLVSRRVEEADAPRWVYLDIGRFGGMAEAEGEAIRYRIETPHDGTPDGAVVIAGPSCDGVDVLYDRCAPRMPLALRAGDRVTIHAAGAYTTSYASQGFNGFPPPSEVFV